MKKTFALVLILIAAPAFAGSYTITTTAGQDAVLTRVMTQINDETCISAGLPAGCSAALLAVSDPSKQLVPNVTALIKQLALQGYQQYKDRADKVDRDAAWAAKTQVQRDAICTSLSMAAGCVPWQ